MTSTILPSFGISDHAPIFAKAYVDGQHQRLALYWMNTDDLKDLHMLQSMQQLWQEIAANVNQDNANISKLFFKRMYESRRITRTIGKEKAKKCREHEKRL